MFYNECDRNRGAFLAGLTEGKVGDHIRKEYQHVRFHHLTFQMVDYCMLKTCRNVFLSKYFDPTGEHLSSCKTRCDDCLHKEKVQQRKRDVFDDWGVGNAKEKKKCVDPYQDLVQIQIEKEEKEEGPQKASLDGFQTAREVQDKRKHKYIEGGFQTAKSFQDKRNVKGSGKGFQTAKDMQ